MGKSPGKWIKTLLLGKKSSKSSLSKGSEKLKSARKEEPVASAKAAVSKLSADPPSISPPMLASSGQNVANPDKVVVDNLPTDAVNLSSARENQSDEVSINLESEDDPGKFGLERAATKVQAAFRGHQARRAFWTLKGIIRLQALVRGHLVRRQAVATLSCVWGIVKFQALVRGRQVRCLDIGIDIQKIHRGAYWAGKSSETSQASTYPWMKNPSKYVIVQKLLVSSPNALPLRLQYGPGEPNSAQDWLERWTRLQVWTPSSQATEKLISNSQSKKGTAETEKGRPKRAIRKPTSANVENNSNRSNSENDKSKRNIRKVSGHPVPSSSKQSLRKLSNSSGGASAVEANDAKRRPGLRKISKASLSDGPEKATSKSAEKRKDTTDAVPKEPARKVSSSSLPDGPENATGKSAEKKKDMADAVLEGSDVETSKKSSIMDNPEQNDLETLENSDETENIQGTNVELCSNNDNVSGDGTKASERRASLPAKIDHQDDVVHSTRKVPSYMAPTESAKARIRGQGSPRFSQERPEINGVARRHSLPSANGKLSTPSPRAQRLVLASGKGSINSDKSLSSSRDAADKMIRAEWRR